MPTITPEALEAAAAAARRFVEELLALGRQLAAAMRATLRALGLLPGTIRPGWPPFAEWQDLQRERRRLRRAFP